METLQVDRAGGVVTVTLDRPAKKNAINLTMWEELEGILAEIRRSADDRAVVVTGAGGEFCSGADLTSGIDTGEPRLAYMRRVGRVAMTLHDIRQPVIAKVRGVAAGAGANLALGCDLIVAAEGSRFSEIFARRALSIDFGGSWLLPRLVGLHRAKELALLADIISADEAFAMGLVNRVVPDAELDGVVADWSARLAAGPTLALSMTKKLLNASYSLTLGEAVEAEAMAQTVNFGTADTAEALQAFLQKREPRFVGF
jgi:enoyl-CoA hydratase/carnithine racemase